MTRVSPSQVLSAMLFMNSDQPVLSATHCRTRQDRVLKILEREALDRAVFVSHENIQYLTGFRPHRLMRAAVCLSADGKCTLAAPNEEPTDAAFDHCVIFEAQWHCTLRQEQLTDAFAALQRAAVSLQTGTTGGEGSQNGLADYLPGPLGKAFVDIEPDLWKLRRRKDPDELLMIRKSIACTEVMYDRARQIIQPGITELEVYNQLHAAAVETAGEPLTALGNDFQCGSPGGPPRPRPAQSGELYILDLGPSYRGYYADNCRTISVDRKPTDAQYRAWDVIVAALEMVETTVRPGVSCREVFDNVKALLDEYCAGAFSHHLGHGFGLYPHEAPHLNPDWDDVFEAGDCFTAEPGLYTKELNAGIRLEQNYVVTETGVNRLTDFSLEM